MLCSHTSTAAPMSTTSGDQFTSPVWYKETHSLRWYNTCAIWISNLISSYICKCCLTLLFEYATYFMNHHTHALGSPQKDQVSWIKIEPLHMQWGKHPQNVCRVYYIHTVLLFYTCTVCSLRESDDMMRHRVPRQKATGNWLLLLQPEQYWPSARSQAAPEEGGHWNPASCCVGPGPC